MTQGIHGASGRVSRRGACLGLMGAALPGLAATTPERPLDRWPARLPDLEGPAPQALGPDAWWWPGAPGETDGRNRGHTVALVAARHRGRLWLVGSGPSPTLGAAWGAWLRQQTGLRPHALMSPWAHAEAVMGQRGLRATQHWAHRDVALAMGQQCPTCESRLRVRLGAAVSDLGLGSVIDLPQRELQGESGEWGPWRWRRLSLAADRSLWVARWRDRPWWCAAGLLWADGPPDLRDADLDAVQAATVALQRFAAGDGSAQRWLPTQGPEPVGPGLLADGVAYWRGLRASVLAQQARGASESDPAAQWPGLSTAWARHPRHALNWQRAWRQLEGT